MRANEGVSPDCLLLVCLSTVQLLLFTGLPLINCFPLHQIITLYICIKIWSFLFLIGSFLPLNLLFLCWFLFCFFLNARLFCRYTPARQRCLNCDGPLLFFFYYVAFYVVFYFAFVPKWNKEILFKQQSTGCRYWIKMHTCTHAQNAEHQIGDNQCKRKFHWVANFITAYHMP